MSEKVNRKGKAFRDLVRGKVENPRHTQKTHSIRSPSVVNGARKEPSQAKKDTASKSWPKRIEMKMAHKTKAAQNKLPESSFQWLCLSCLG